MKFTIKSCAIPKAEFTECVKTLTDMVVRDSEKYVPYDTGRLSGSVRSEAGKDRGAVSWNTEYAGRVYRGNNMKFKTEKHPDAGANWFERAKNENVSFWCDGVKNSVKFTQK